MATTRGKDGVRIELDDDEGFDPQALDGISISDPYGSSVSPERVAGLSEPGALFTDAALANTNTALEEELDEQLTGVDVGVPTSAPLYTDADDAADDEAAERHLDEQIDPPTVSDEFDPIHGNELGMKLEDEVEPGANHMTVELAGEVFNLVDERIVPKTAEFLPEAGVGGLSPFSPSPSGHEVSGVLQDYARGLCDPAAEEDAFVPSRVSHDHDEEIRKVYALMDEGKTEEAITLMNEVIEIDPHQLLSRPDIAEDDEYANAEANDGYFVGDEATAADSE